MSDGNKNLKTEMELRGHHLKIDLMMAEQINLLLELKEMKK